jgi:hypothetical protein
VSVELEALRSHQAGGVMLRFKGDRLDFEEMVWRIKALHTRERQWMSEAFERRGGWWLSHMAFKKVGPLFKNYVEMRRRIESETASSASSPCSIPPQVERAFAVLHLRTTAPSWVVQAVYCVLAKRAHPDAGGSHEAMKAVNLAYEQALAWAEQRDMLKANVQIGRGNWRQPPRLI